MPSLTRPLPTPTRSSCGVEPGSSAKRRATIGFVRGPRENLATPRLSAAARPGASEGDSYLWTLRSFGRGERHPACEASGSLDL